MQGPDGNDMTIGNNVTSDVNVRKALSIGIDREKVIQNAFNGIGQPAYGFTDNLVWAFTELDRDNQKEEAKAILEEAGWVLGRDGIREKDGVKCEFDVYTWEMSRYLLASAVAEDAVELGIRINAKNSDRDETRKNRHTSGVLWGWGQYDPMVLHYLLYSELFLNGTSANVGGYNNPQADSFINRAIGSSSEADAIAMWKETQRVANNDFPYLHIVNIEHCYFVSDALDVSLATQIPHPHGHGSPIICNMKDWKFR
jgi:peptide/nickel transport system substrate-binding protein